MLHDDLLTQIAFSVSENRGVFALILGSGLSKAAEIPTGWDITLDLLRKVAEVQGVANKTDPAAWYRKLTGKEPNYSTLLAELASSPAERRAILQGYIEPTDEDRAVGRKLPTTAHNAIAQLVASGHVRVIVTTNFDRLMENALRERGIEPTIVASPDALAGAEPLTHSACYLVKLHGDYKDTRILNTDAELATYPLAYKRLLARIFDEHGLIVCGWSGAWDVALRDAVLRAPNRRYPTFWAARGEPNDEAGKLIAHRRARVLQIADADSFFGGLQQRVETLERVRGHNPRSIDLLVGSAKRFLGRPEFRIQLDDLLSEQVGLLLERMDDFGAGLHGNITDGAFQVEAARYEAASEGLVRICGILGRWGDGTELPEVLGILQTLFFRYQRKRGVLKLPLYPGVLIFVAYGLGLVHRQGWKDLYRLFMADMMREERSPHPAYRVFLPSESGVGHPESWKSFDVRHFHQVAAFSEYLGGRFNDWADSFVSVSQDFGLLFDRFELLGALAGLEQMELTELVLQSDSASRILIGRIAFREVALHQMVHELTAGDQIKPLVDAGFGRFGTRGIRFFVRSLQMTAQRMEMEF